MSKLAIVTTTLFAVSPDRPDNGWRSDRHLSSLREYLDALRDLGELQEIAREVDWNLEIGAVPKVWDRVMTSEDAREGIQSFVERPAAVFPRMLIDDLSREWTK